MHCDRELDLCLQVAIQAKYLQNLLSCLDPTQVEIGHTHSLSQPLLLTVCQALHKSIIAPSIGDEAWPVNHIKP